MLFDEAPNGVESLRIARAFSVPLESGYAEYAGWVRIVGTWIHFKGLSSQNTNPNI